MTRSILLFIVILGLWILSASYFLRALVIYITN